MCTCCLETVATDNKARKNQLISEGSRIPVSKIRSDETFQLNLNITIFFRFRSRKHKRGHPDSEGENNKYSNELVNAGIFEHWSTFNQGQHFVPHFGYFSLLDCFYLVAFSDSTLLHLMLYSFISNSQRVRKEYTSFCINQLITDKMGRQLVENFGAFLILYSCMYIIKIQIWLSFELVSIFC